MKISELEASIAKFKEFHGDIEVDASYYCDDCDDEHDGNGIRVILNPLRRMAFEIIRLGEDDFGEDDFGEDD